MRPSAWPIFAEAPFRGVGFGLGFAVMLDAVPGRTLGSEGEFSWGGAASTAFFVDPSVGLTVSFFTQLLPSSSHPIRSQHARSPRGYRDGSEHRAMADLLVVAAVVAFVAAMLGMTWALGRL